MLFSAKGVCRPHLFLTKRGWAGWTPPIDLKSLCISACLSICLSACLFVYLSCHGFTRQFIHASIRLSISLSTFLSVDQYLDTCNLQLDWEEVIALCRASPFSRGSVGRRWCLCLAASGALKNCPVNFCDTELWKEARGRILPAALELCWGIGSSGPNLQASPRAACGGPLDIQVLAGATLEGLPILPELLGHIARAFS